MVCGWNRAISSFALFNFAEFRCIVAQKWDRVVMIIIPLTDILRNAVCELQHSGVLVPSGSCSLRTFPGLLLHQKNWDGMAVWKLCQHEAGTRYCRLVLNLFYNTLAVMFLSWVCLRLTAVNLEGADGSQLFHKLFLWDWEETCCSKTKNLVHIFYFWSTSYWIFFAK